MKWLTSDKLYPARWQGSANAKKRKWYAIDSLLLLLLVVVYSCGCFAYRFWHDKNYYDNTFTLEFSHEEFQWDEWAYMRWVHRGMKVVFDDCSYVVPDIPKEETRVKVVYEPVPRLDDLLYGTFPLLPVVFVATVFMIILNYRSYRRPAKGYYLMQRLPNRWEMHKRCLLLPLAELLLHVIICVTVCLVCYLIYRHCSLPERLPMYTTFRFWRIFAW